MDELTTVLDQPGHLHALDERAAFDALLDDVGDPDIDPVEQRLETSEHPGFHDQVAGECLEARDRVGALAGGQLTAADVAADVTQLLLHTRVRLGADLPPPRPVLIDAGGVWRQARRQQTLGVDDKPQVQRGGESLL
ncbi:hypothetical protein [Nocardioides panacisoli]|uniref:hypothetical protein n=1 Tax=Nocardioides panacisoli TaxID=627624 RepID=UPI0031D49BA5